MLAYGQAMLAWPDLFERIGSVSLGKLDPRTPFRWSGAGMLMFGAALVCGGFYAHAAFVLLFAVSQFFARPDSTASPAPEPDPPSPPE
jgi:hypothetical protein